MCGIIGYYGLQGAQKKLLEGLKKLEYRGYDSAGIALAQEQEPIVLRAVGTVEQLETVMPQELDARIGIGHTRWATHGAVTKENAHPHQSKNKQFLVVHNGIIENHATLRAELEKNGFTFSSETDTEVIAHLIEFFYEQDLLEAVKKTLSKIEGAYAIVVLDNNSQTLIAAKIGSPLMVGITKEEYFVSSDPAAFVQYTQQSIILEDEQLVIINNEGLSLQDFQGFNVDIETTSIPYGIEAIQKDGYEHFMLKEIYEQASAIKNCFAGKIRDFNTINIPKKEYDKISFLGCGTSYYAGLVAQYFFEKNNKILSTAELSSEFRYKQPIIRAGDLIVALSQSGETADTLEALGLAQKHGANLCGLINTPGSSIARLCNQGMYLHAGPEISVASTKAFTTQITAALLLSAHLSNNQEYREHIRQELEQTPKKVQTFLEQQQLQKIAQEITDASCCLFIGRKQLYPVALEGALKLQEVSYIPAQGFAAGELKHGPLALIEQATPVVCLLREDEIKEKTITSIQEAKSRGAKIILITDYEDEITKKIADHTIIVPKSSEETSPIHYVIPLQLLAYYVACTKQLDVDKPRNLAKAVTVE